ncbi:MAG: hypothetical protein WBW41_12580 [Verrucomicrobiia bacterium]
MSPFWNNLYDSFKDRRYAALFLFALGAFVLSPVLLSVMALYGLSRGVSAFRHTRAKRRNKWRYAPLSRDELRVARSKLVKVQSLKKS